MFPTSVGIQKDRVFDIANVPFEQVSDDEKIKYMGKMLETGSYQGYKLRQYWVSRYRRSLLFCAAFSRRMQHINGGVRDQIENYNSKC